MGGRFGFQQVVRVIAATALLAVAMPAATHVSANVGATADLSITITDGVTIAVPGTSVVYTITASNAGPSAATGAIVTDPLPAGLSATWTCVGAGGGTCNGVGSGSINEAVNLPVGGSVTYTVSAAISPAATGTISNTVSVTAPLGVVDSNGGNNDATDTDTLTPQADLSITKTDGVTEVLAGTPVSYTITVANAGPSSAIGATVADPLPNAIGGGTWTCVGAGGGSCTAAGSGDINDTIDLPVGGSVTYTLSSTVFDGASGPLGNTATVTAPAGVTDPNLADNSATDTDTVDPVINLSITKTDGVTNAAPGGTVTYTIRVDNPGGPLISGVTVTDILPVSLTNATWTCTASINSSCTAAGTGNINDIVTIGVTERVTYTVTATISPLASGTLTNTATVTPPVGTTDTDPGNNSATDSDTLTANSVFTLTKTGPAHALAGDDISYEITVGNSGPSNASHVALIDDLPAGTTFVSMTYNSGPLGVVSTPAVGATGAIDIEYSTFPAGDQASITLVVHIEAATLGGTVISNTATVGAAPAVTVVNSPPVIVGASDTATTVIDPTSELSLSKQLQGTLVAGTNAVYTLTVQNNGPDATATTLTLTDVLPAALDYVSASGTGWVCGAAAQTVTCTRATPLAAGASTTVTLTVHVHADATGTIINEAAVSGVDSDAIPSNDVASAAGAVTPTTPAPTTTLHGALPPTGSDASGFAQLAMVLTGLGLAAVAITATRRPRTS